MLSDNKRRGYFCIKGNNNNMNNKGLKFRKINLFCLFSNFQVSIKKYFSIVSLKTHFFKKKMYDLNTVIFRNFSKWRKIASFFFCKIALHYLHDCINKREALR